jgi:UPF0042 nucleotide-binding protein
MQLVLVTGLSGSGKSVAIRELEDSGYFCIDNLPAHFLPEVCASLQEEGYERVAVAIDSRSPSSLAALPQVLGSLVGRGINAQLVFLQARDHELLQRFSETRRRHPLAPAAEGVAEHGLLEAIARERAMLEVLHEGAVTLDTTGVLPRQLRSWVRELASAQHLGLTLSLESFAFKNGVPEHADLVFDARCLPNPHYDEALRPLSGKDQAVDAYLQASEQGPAFVACIEGWLRRWIPHYRHDQRAYLTVAVGCTGGQHRSVWAVEQLVQRLGDLGVIARHRAIERTA